MVCVTVMSSYCDLFYFLSLLVFLSGVFSSIFILSYIYTRFLVILFYSISFYSNKHRTYMVSGSVPCCSSVTSFVLGASLSMITLFSLLFERMLLQITFFLFFFFHSIYAWYIWACPVSLVPKDLFGYIALIR
jgi:hypothetical protein